MFLIMKLLSFSLIVYGCFRVFHITAEEMKDGVAELFKPKEENVRQKIELAKGKKKRKGFALLVKETQSLLILLNKQAEFPIICFTSFLLAVIVAILCIAYNNMFLIVPLEMIATAAPFVYIRHRSISYKKIINEELETALSIITNSYIRNDNIIVAVEENIAYIHDPIRRVFKEFIFNCDYVDSDIKRNLRLLKQSLNNAVFSEWCNSLISCQSDRSIKYTLPAIVKKLSNIRLVSVRLDSMLYEPVREYIIMVIILLFNIPVFYVLNKEWYRILTQTQIGHIVMAVCVLIIAITAAGVTKLTKPIEYKR